VIFFRPLHMPPKVMERHMMTPSQRWEELEQTLGSISARLDNIETLIGELKEHIHVRAILRV
jgi:hypothetical protein